MQRQALPAATTQPCSCEYISSCLWILPSRTSYRLKAQDRSIWRPFLASANGSGPTRRCRSRLRGRFIIDPDGVIQAAEMLTPPVGRRLAETVRHIQAYRVVRASKGAEATPAGWMPGEATLEPGPTLVGNVWKVWKPPMEKKRARGLPANNVSLPTGVLPLRCSEFPRTCRKDEIEPVFEWLDPGQGDSLVERAQCD